MDTSLSHVNRTPNELFIDAAQDEEKFNVYIRIEQNLPFIKIRQK